eukprot:1337713-Lingulodinium_polyedra.AAC.1
MSWGQGSTPWAATRGGGWRCWPLAMRTQRRLAVVASRQVLASRQVPRWMKLKIPGQLGLTPWND